MSFQTRRYGGEEGGGLERPGFYRRPLLPRRGGAPDALLEEQQARRGKCQVTQQRSIAAHFEMVQAEFLAPLIERGLIVLARAGDPKDDLRRGGALAVGDPRSRGAERPLALAQRRTRRHVTVTPALQLLEELSIGRVLDAAGHPAEPQVVRSRSVEQVERHLGLRAVLDSRRDARRLAPLG